MVDARPWKNIADLNGEAFPKLVFVISQPGILVSSHMQELVTSRMHRAKLSPLSDGHSAQTFLAGMVVVRSWRFVTDLEDVDSLTHHHLHSSHLQSSHLTLPLGLCVNDILDSATCTTRIPIPGAMLATRDLISVLSAAKFQYQCCPHSFEEPEVEELAATAKLRGDRERSGSPSTVFG